MPSGRLPMSQDRVDRILQLYKDGHSKKAVSKMVGVSQPTVYRCLKRNGLVGLRQRKLSQEKIDTILELYQSGLSATQCGERVGCKTETVLIYLRKNGITPKSSADWSKGELNPAWRGGRHIARGYIYLLRPDHPYSRNGYVREHRLVMEEHIGRYLLPGEVVHHKDKDKSNNSIENLELFASNGEHLAHELKGCVPKWTESGKRRMYARHHKADAPSDTCVHTTPDGRQLSLFPDQTET